MVLLNQINGMFRCFKSETRSNERRFHMKSNDFSSMGIDELWSLHEQVSSLLARKISEEKAKLEKRLRTLEIPVNAMGLHQRRRPYPKVLPKYQNPNDPEEKWSGRGRQPHWVKAQLKSGKKLERFLIAR